MSRKAVLSSKGGRRNLQDGRYTSLDYHVSGTTISKTQHPEGMHNYKPVLMDIASTDLALSCGTISLQPGIPHWQVK
jgi:hypothetical protein